MEETHETNTALSGESIEPKVLQAKRGIRSVADLLRSSGRRNVMVMLGAGASTSAGIPDFRSPNTGLYSNLEKLNLPYPEAVFSIDFFRENPTPFYALAAELYPGKYRPTLTHCFVRLLADKGLLLKCFTQNIDTLERRAGVPEEMVCEAHGSFATQRCVECGAPFSVEDKGEAMRRCVREGRIPRCGLACGGVVKPDIVFFGESVPLDFIRCVPYVDMADLLIVIGTSLKVNPFASLARMVEEGGTCPRVLINLEGVGDFGSREDDTIFLGKCDEIVEQLCRELGWEEELLKLWEETADTVEKGETEAKDTKIEEQTVPEADLEEESLQLKPHEEETDALASVVERIRNLDIHEQVRDAAPSIEEKPLPEADK